MSKTAILKVIADEVKKQFLGEGTGHDWWHIDRVRKIALEIAKQETADLFVVELAALLHDIADHKFHGGDLTKGGKVARRILTELKIEAAVIDKVCYIVDNVSYKGAADKSKMQTLEGQAVQDADRLDALGAIGIGRAFTVGGHFGKTLYDPNTKPALNMGKEEYVKHRSDTINHFYEKVLLLKDRMNTKVGREMAEERHKFVEEFLERFYKEWNGEI